eukprot:343533_1
MVTFFNCLLLILITSIVSENTIVIESNNQLCKSRLFNTISGVWTSDIWSNTTYETPSCALHSTDVQESTIWFGSSNGLKPDFRWNYNNFTLDLKLQLHGNSGHAGLLFKASNVTTSTNYGGQYYYISLHPCDDLFCIGSVNNNWWLENGISYSIQPNTTYTITIKASVPLYNIYINNKLMLKD